MHWFLNDCMKQGNYECLCVCVCVSVHVCVLAYIASYIKKVSMELQGSAAIQFMPLYSYRWYSERKSPGAHVKDVKTLYLMWDFCLLWLEIF